MAQYIFWILAVDALVVGYVWYMVQVTRRNKALEAFSGVDVQLKKRADLIPNVLSLAQKFMTHEKALLNDITQLRTEVQKLAQTPLDARDLHQQLNLEHLLGGRMGQLMVAVENYPDLKSQSVMQEAQRAYMDVEENIAAARRFYNASVNSLRNSLQVFPGGLIAKISGVTDMPLFEADEASRQPVSAKEFLS